jgi:hypothetical protein
VGEDTETSLEISDIMTLTQEEFKAKCDRVWKGVEYDTTYEPVLTEEVMSGFAMRMLVEYDAAHRERLLKSLDAVVRHLTIGWEADPILSMYCQPKPKPNKYQRRYARIGRRRKK